MNTRNIYIFHVLDQPQITGEAP